MLAHTQADSPLAGVLASTRVLLVEDAPDPQRTYLTMLRHTGADVGLECNGMAAVTTALAAVPVFDLVIMDMAVQLDGMNAARELRRQGFASPILVLNRSGEDMHQNLWRDAGCNLCMTKPVTLAKFVAAILRLMSADGPV